jgi:hypothetical protein
MNWKQLAVFLILPLLFAAPNTAQADLMIQITNDGFESTTNGGGQLGYNTNAIGWTISGGTGYLLPSGSADTTGVTGQNGNFQLWGPNNSLAYIPAAPPNPAQYPQGSGGPGPFLPASSPDGGNYIALMANQTGSTSSTSISEMITGLTFGDWYSGGMWVATAQQYGYTGRTGGMSWSVSLGDPTVAGSPPLVYVAGIGFISWSNSSGTTLGSLLPEKFSGWEFISFDSFVATSTSETLTITAGNALGFTGTNRQNEVNQYEGAFVLVDGVTLQDLSAPEIDPGSVGSAFTFLFGGLAMLKYRYRRPKPAVSASRWLRE